MTLSASMGLASCSPSFNRAKLTDKLLYEKYKQEFTTVMVSGYSLTAKTFIAYSFLNSNPEVKITSYVDNDSNSIQDDFNLSTVKYELLQSIKNTLNDSTFRYEMSIYSAFRDSVFMNANFTVQEWFHANPKLHYQVFVYIADDEKIIENAKAIYQSFTLFLDVHNSFIGSLKIYAISPNYFDSFTEDIKNIYFYDSAFFLKLKNSKIFESEVRNGRYISTLEEFIIFGIEE